VLQCSAETAPVITGSMKGPDGTAHPMAPSSCRIFDPKTKEMLWYGILYIYMSIDPLLT
jgi:hypothetical protein